MPTPMIARRRAASWKGFARIRSRCQKPTAQLEAMLGRLDANAYMARSHVHLGLAWLTS